MCKYETGVVLYHFFYRHVVLFDVWSVHGWIDRYHCLIVASHIDIMECIYCLVMLVTIAGPLVIAIGSLTGAQFAHVMKFSLNLFYSGRQYTEKDWVGLKMRHYPLHIKFHNIRHR